MSKSVTDERLGYMIGKMWSDYVRGLIMLTEFDREVFALMVEHRTDTGEPHE